ncbi:MAG: ribosome biogenesis/translation initiation ATPase RLI, partial [Candidatus Hydrothermarchaeota archaeon]|nr:ribosome biogenesis/translation initiation ATPase RLI [Candidatus Hydrothermarchaeota archaeon]
MRIAVIDFDVCQPKKCAKECIKYCPGIRIGDETIAFSEEKGKPVISEELCTGCGICPKKCPFKAIYIVGLPDELREDLIHQYGENAFRLFRLPYPRDSAVTGLIGQNGIGKTTIVRILSGEIVPNFGDLEEACKEKVLEYFSGTQFYDYFDALYKKSIKTAHKPQYVDTLPEVAEGSIKALLEKIDERGELRNLAKKMEIEDILERNINTISGGELQRVAIAACLGREADIYILDEPSSYLDARQRLNVAKVIREVAEKKRVLVVEHDLIVVDYLADYVTMMYGKAAAYGIVSHPRTVRQGINVYLGGYLREENIRFRTEPVKFEVRAPSLTWENEVLLKFEDLKKSYNGFSLEVKGGEVNKGEVVGVLGPNATGKTTFVKMLAGAIKPDAGSVDIKVRVSYKPQYIKPEFGGSVLEALSKLFELGDPFFRSEIARPLNLEHLFNRALNELSGGELQRVAIAACLGREADVYLLDEPSAYLDVEQRLNAARMIRKVMEKKGSTGIIVDHDILFTDYISDRLMIFHGVPGIKGFSTKLLGMKEGMNAFLKDIGVTFRRDPETGRP